MRKNLYRKKSLNWVLVMWHMWLVWILTTKHKFLKRVENLERYVIFPCHHLLILLIKWFLFCCVYLLFRFILQTVLLSGYLSFSICSTLNPDCLFIRLWMTYYSRYIKWCPDFLFLRSVPLFPYSSYMIIPFNLNWAVMVKIISSCLCSPVVVQSAMRQVVSHFWCCD
jgi:hypothetical protein